MSEAIRAKASEFQETMDFLEAAFKEHKIKEPRFERLLPDLYQPVEEAMGNIFVLRDDASGKIVSSAGLFPMDLRLWGRPLRIQGVGGVGTLPEFRGKGLMNKVLASLNAELLKRGAPFAWLSGLRHRYDVWGYEKAGCALLLQLIKPNLKARKSAGFAVEELKPEAVDLSELLAIREATPCGSGSADIASMKLKRARPSLRVLRAVKGEEKAFAIVGEGGVMADFFGAPEGVADIAMKLLESEEGVQFRVAIDDAASFDALSPLAEDFSIIMQGNFAVADLAACLELLKDNPAAQELPAKGRRSVDFVMEAGANPEQRASLVLENGALRVERGATANPSTSEIKLSPTKMASLLFGPLKPSQLLGEDAPAWLETLLPIPVLVPRLYWV